MRTKSLYSLSLVLALVLLLALPAPVFCRQTCVGQCADPGGQRFSWSAGSEPDETQLDGPDHVVLPGRRGVPRQLRQCRRCNEPQYRQGLRRRHDRCQPAALGDIPR